MARLWQVDGSETCTASTETSSPSHIRTNTSPLPFDSVQMKFCSYFSCKTVRTPWFCWYKTKQQHTPKGSSHNCQITETTTLYHKILLCVDSKTLTNHFLYKVKLKQLITEQISPVDTRWKKQSHTFRPLQQRKEILWTVLWSKWNIVAPKYKIKIKRKWGETIISRCSSGFEQAQLLWNV